MSLREADGLNSAAEPLVLYSPRTDSSVAGTRRITDPNMVTRRL